MTRPIRPGDIVRHRGTGNYPDLRGHYGIVQQVGWDLGVEWDRSPAYPKRGRTLQGHALGGMLSYGRHRCGWYVAADDVEML